MVLEKLRKIGMLEDSFENCSQIKQLIAGGDSFPSISQYLASNSLLSKLQTVNSEMYL